jgi:hypothetical protein
LLSVRELPALCEDTATSEFLFLNDFFDTKGDQNLFVAPRRLRFDHPSLTGHGNGKSMKQPEKAMKHNMKTFRLWPFAIWPRKSLARPLSR